MKTLKLVGIVIAASIAGLWGFLNVLSGSYRLYGSDWVLKIAHCISHAQVLIAHCISFVFASILVVVFLLAFVLYLVFALVSICGQVCDACAGRLQNDPERWTDGHTAAYLHQIKAEREARQAASDFNATHPTLWK